MRSRWELMTYLSVSAVLILKESPTNKAHVLNSSPRLTQIGRNTLVLFQRSFTNSGGSTLPNFIRAWPNFILFYFYRPQRSCEGCFYTCLSVHGGVCLSACWDTPETRLPRSRHPSGPGTPPPADGYCCRRYASYWNAFLYSIWFLWFSCWFVHIQWDNDKYFLPPAMKCLSFCPQGGCLPHTPRQTPP